MTDNSQNSGPIPSVDTELGRLVVEQNLATPDEVQECLSLQSTFGEDQSQQSLAQVMIGQGVVTPRQITRVKKTIEDTRKRRIPGYQILSKLGSGAMATVYKARQLSLDRMVAIKILPTEVSLNEEYVERFYKEGKAAAKLNHPNIVQAFDVGEANGVHYFVMEYVKGHTLYDELADGKVFSEAEALKAIIQIAQALEHAHAQDLIHRDVKPKNIMVSEDGTTKLADMGLARIATDSQAAQAEAGRAFGTPYYISPEQIRGEMDIDFRADIYSLGATLYHLITGRVPFEAPTPVAVMQKHLKEPLIPPDHINTALSAGIGEVVEVMMAKDSKDRYASTTDLLVDLEAISSGEPPLLARKHISTSVLSALADEAVGGDTTIELDQDRRNLTPLLILLVALLFASLVVNLLLFLEYFSS